MAISKITTSGVSADTLTAADLAPNSVDSSELVDGSIDTSHLSNNIAISTSGAITTTGAFTSVGIDDNASGAVAITIDSSENVGIGTTAIGTSSHNFGGQHNLTLGGATANSFSVLEIAGNDADDNAYIGGIEFVNKNNSDAAGGTAEGVSAIVSKVETDDSNAGDDSGGHLQFWTKPNGGNLTDRMIVDSSGKVGIGVTPRSDWVSTRIGLQIGPRTVLWGESGNNNTLLSHNVYETSSGYAGIANGACNFHLFSGGEWNYRTGTNSAGAGGTVSMTNRLRFDTAGRMWVGPVQSTGPWGDSSGTGSLRFNSIAASENNNMALSSDSSNGYALIYLNAIDGANDERYIGFFRNGSQIGSVSLNGTSNVSFDTSSDYRLKENVELLTGSVARLKNIKPSKYNFISEPDRECEGFIAHELQEYVPRAVSGVKDQMWPEVLYTDEDELPEGKKIGDVKEEEKIKPQGVDFSRLTPLLVGALQEIITRVEALETA